MAEQAQTNEQRTEAAKKQLAEQKEARDKKQAELNEASAGVKPTPTQEENDLAKMGVYVPEHEPDGSPPEDPNAPQDKRSGPTPTQRAGYRTRSSTPTSE
jgi:hypothetical protein